MAKLYKPTKNTPILWQAAKVGLTKNELCRTLGVSLNTLNTWIVSPEIMQLKHIYVMAGLFGLSVEELVYILVRNKAQVKTKSLNGKWYIESIRDKYK